MGGGGDIKFGPVLIVFISINLEKIDEGQITHLVCARLKDDLYDFFRGCFGPASCSFLVEKAQKHPLKKSYRSYFRRARIRS